MSEHSKHKKKRHRRSKPKEKEMIMGMRRETFYLTILFSIMLVTLLVLAYVNAS